MKYVSRYHVQNLGVVRGRITLDKTFKRRNPARHSFRYATLLMICPNNLHQNLRVQRLHNRPTMAAPPAVMGSSRAAGVTTIVAAARSGSSSSPSLNVDIAASGAVIVGVVAVLLADPERNQLNETQHC